MDCHNILDLVQQCTESLVAEKLRSTSIVIERLEGLIAKANRLGHSHSTIHARLQAGGLDASWNNYRVCLVRLRKKTARAAGMAQAAPPEPSLSTAASIALDATAEHDPQIPISSPTHVLDALAEAKQTASRDYAQVARDHHRKTRK